MPKNSPSDTHPVNRRIATGLRWRTVGHANVERGAQLPRSLANKRFSVHGQLCAARSKVGIVDVRDDVVSAVDLRASVHRVEWCLTWT